MKDEGAEIGDEASRRWVPGAMNSCAPQKPLAPIGANCSAGIATPSRAIVPTAAAGATTLT